MCCAFINYSSRGVMTTITLDWGADSLEKFIASLYPPQSADQRNDILAFLNDTLSMYHWELGVCALGLQIYVVVLTFTRPVGGTFVYVYVTCYFSAHSALRVFTQQPNKHRARAEPLIFELPNLHVNTQAACTCRTRVARPVRSNNWAMHSSLLRYHYKITTCCTLCKLVGSERCI